MGLRPKPTIRWGSAPNPQYDGAPPQTPPGGGLRPFAEGWRRGRRPDLARAYARLDSFRYEPPDLDIRGFGAASTPRPPAARPGRSPRGTRPPRATGSPPDSHLRRNRRNSPGGR